MKRFTFTRAVTAFAVLAALAAGIAYAQGGMRTIMERKAWYVNADGRTGEMAYWRLFLGNFDVKLRRNIPGEGQITVDAGMDFQLLSSGYVEGNGASARGRMQSQPSMRIRIDGNSEQIWIDSIAYIHDYGSKVVLKSGRRGDFIIGGEGGEMLTPKRFQVTEFRQTIGQYGEPELTIVRDGDMRALAAVAFTKEAAVQAAQEPR